MRRAKEPEVVIFDLWNTVIHGLSVDPILTLWQTIVEGNGQPIPATCPPEFMNFCHTACIARPGKLVEEACRRFDFTPHESIKKRFRLLLAEERRAVAKFPETDEVIARLARGASARRLGVISNLWKFPVNRIEALLGIHQFEHVVYSFEVGFNKPSPRIFAEALFRFGVEPGRCLMVGDSLSSDIEGALAAGMQAAFVYRSQAPVPMVPTQARVIHDLRQL